MDISVFYFLYWLSDGYSVMDYRFFLIVNKNSGDNFLKTALIHKRKKFLYTLLY